MKTTFWPNQSDFLHFVPATLVIFGLFLFITALIRHYFNHNIKMKELTENASNLGNTFEGMRKRSSKTSTIVLLVILTLALLGATPILLGIASMGALLNGSDGETVFRFGLFVFIGIPWAIVAFLWKKITL